MLSASQTAESTTPPAFVPRPQPKHVEVKPDPMPQASLSTGATPEETSQLAQEIKKEIDSLPTKKEQLIPASIPVQSAKPVVAPAKAEDSISGIAYARQAEPDRPQMVDIKQPMKVVGPVEELGMIDIAEFRRLGNGPEASADKILEKIELLQEESWQTRMDGVRAWKQSEIAQLYVAIGRESIDRGMPLENVLRSRGQENKPCISLDEFFAINRVNSILTA
jgi:hypothetical protein